MTDIESNLKEVRANIATSLREANRRDDEVLLVGVTKTHPVEFIEQGISLGISDVGENKAQEFVYKYDIIKNKVKWHFIGHLQKNKVKYVVGKAALIHSVDSLELAETISKRATQIGIVQDILIEVNVSGETSKFGMRGDELKDLLLQMADLPGIRIRGLMTMAPNVADEMVVRGVFRGLRSLRDKLVEEGTGNLDLKELSMGMSQDYPLAILEGATIIRVGSLIYGHR